MSENKNTRGDIVYISNGSLEDILEHSLTGELDIPVSVDPYPKNIEHSEYILKSKYDELLKIGANERILWQLNNLNNNLRTLQSKYDLLLKEKEELEKKLSEKNERPGQIRSITISGEQLEEWKERDVKKWVDVFDKPSHVIVIDKDGNKSMYEIKPTEK